MTDTARQVNLSAPVKPRTDRRPQDALSALAAFHVDLDTSTELGAGWLPGPLPVPVALRDDGHSPIVPASETWRRRVVWPQAANLLYGGYREVARWHRQSTGRVPKGGSYEAAKTVAAKSATNPATREVTITVTNTGNSEIEDLSILDKTPLISTPPRSVNSEGGLRRYPQQSRRTTELQLEAHYWSITWSEVHLSPGETRKFSYSIDLPVDITVTQSVSMRSDSVAGCTVKPGCKVIAESGSESVPDFTVVGAELLLLPPMFKGTRRGVLLVHLDLDGSYPTDPSQRCVVLARLNTLTRGLLRPAADEEDPLSWELPAELESFAPESCTATPGYLNALVGIHRLTHADHPEPIREPYTPEPQQWTVEDSWNWHLAMCSPPTRKQLLNMSENVPPEPGHLLRLAQSTIRLTRLGFVQTSRVLTNNGNSQFALQDLRRFRTVYADGLLLVVAQQRLLDCLTEETCRIGDPASDSHTFRQIASNLRIFRNRWWLREYSHWHQPDRLLRHYQEVLGLDKTYDDLKEDHEFFAAIAQASETTFFNRTLLALTFFSIISCVATVLALFGDNIHQGVLRIWALLFASVIFGAITYALLRRSGLTWRKR